MIVRYASVLVLTLAAATAARAAAPGTASGTLTVNGKPVALAHATAAPHKNPFDAKKTDVVLLLTNVAVDPSVMADDFGRMKLSGKGNFSGVEVEIDPEGQVISGTLYSPEFKKFNGSISATGMHQFEGKVTASSVEGKLFIPKDDDFAGYTYKYDATFNAPFAAPAAAAAKVMKGAALPADGGAPGKAYRDYLAALKAGDLVKLARFVDAEHAAQMKTPDFKQMLKMIQAMEPTDVRITNGSVDGSKATLDVTGKDGAQTSTGTIDMVMEGGAWKLAKESWSTK